MLTVTGPVAISLESAHGVRVTGDGMTGDDGDGVAGGAAEPGYRQARAVDNAADGARSVQPMLPILRGLVRQVEEDGDAGFAHPFERDFARILSFYQIRWAYEPTAFALSWNGDGQPAELFTPDFYLPEERLYIELTAMRQRLVTRKHRKLRRLRELYPDVRIKLLYRRDYQRLAAAYGTARNRAARFVGRVLFDEETIRQRIGAIADQIALADGGSDGRQQAADGSVGEGRPLVLLAVGRGSAVFHDALRAELVARGVAVETDRITLSRYRTGSGRRRVRVRRPPAVDLRGRRLLVVEDVISTGLTLAYLLRWLRRRGACPEVCALLDRRAARVVEAPIRYAAFEAPNEALVGFGLSLYRRFRELPFIAVLEP